MQACAFSLLKFNCADPNHHALAAELWSAACGQDLRISPAFVTYNTQCSTGGKQAGQIAMLSGRPGQPADKYAAAGFILASTTEANPVNPLGWIDAIAVHPAYQRRGIGSALLAWAAAWLGESGCQLLQLGGGLRPFVPGLPQPCDSAHFFYRQGFQSIPDHQYVWDMAHRLDEYVSPPLKKYPAEVRPVQIGEVDILFDFLKREFPGRWEYECQEFFREGGRSTDYFLLHTTQGVAGFCATTLEDSHRPLDRYYMHRLPRPWGQLGSIGIASAQRGHGLGAILIDAVLQHLKRLGVRGCVIDWTELVDLYAKFDFKPYSQYLNLFKTTGLSLP